MRLAKTFSAVIGMGYSSLRDAVLEPNEEPAAALGPQPTRRFEFPAPFKR